MKLFVASFKKFVMMAFVVIASTSFAAQANAIQTSDWRMLSSDEKETVTKVFYIYMLGMMSNRATPEERIHLALIMKTAQSRLLDAMDTYYRRVGSAPYLKGIHDLLLDIVYSYEGFDMGPCVARSGFLFGKANSQEQAWQDRASRLAFGN